MNKTRNKNIRVKKKEGEREEETRRTGGKNYKKRMGEERTGKDESKDKWEG